MLTPGISIPLATTSELNKIPVLASLNSSVTLVRLDWDILLWISHVFKGLDSWRFWKTSYCIPAALAVGRKHMTEEATATKVRASPAGNVRQKRACTHP